MINLSKNSPANQSQTFEQEVLGELIQLHLQVLKRMPVVQLFLVIGLSLLVYNKLHILVIIAWGFLTVLAEITRCFYAHQIESRKNLLKHVERIHFRLIVLAALSGVTVGLSAVIFLPVMPLPNQAVLAIILFAMPAAGVSVAVSSKPILGAYAFFILAPTAAMWAKLYPAQIITVIGLTLLYWLFIISVAADGKHLLRRSVEIRRERDLAIQHLERRNAEDRIAVAKAESLSQTRARILATASHDLRQPLHALSIYSVVLASNPTPDALPEVAQSISRLVQSLTSLLNGLLDLSRFSAEYYVPQRQQISLDRLVKEVGQECHLNPEYKNIQLVFELGHVYLFDDPIAIGRIARNLLDNAFKYTENGKVTVITTYRDESACLIVVDTGRGIPLNEQNRIFEEFYQLACSDANEAFKGVGLGLAIVKHLCNLIGADISLVSVPGSGSRFCVRFATITH